jgi:hypothetical protein
MTYYLYLKVKGKKDELIADSRSKRLIEMTMEAHIITTGGKLNKTNRSKYKIIEK